MAEIKLRECKFVMHVPAIEGVREDFHMVKELVTYDDGTTRNKLTWLRDFKRPFYVTKKHKRRHKQKKEFEYLDNVNTHYSTQSDLANNIAIKIEKGYYKKNNLRDVVDNPYLYGVDVNSCTYIKRIYQEKYPDNTSEFTVCTLDIENDVDTGIISVITVSMKDKIYTAIHKDLIKNHPNAKETIIALYDKWVPDTQIKKDVGIPEIKIFDNELDIIVNVFKKVHSWMPDFLTVWNLNYDIPKIMSVLDKYGMRYEDVFCDPTINKKLRLFKYKEGQKQRVTESGRIMAINPEQQWHTAYNTASFVMIDAMAAYSYVRVGQAAVPGGYSLDNILKHNKINTKLTFDNEIKYKGADWHKYMVAQKPLEYVVYNIYDTTSMLVLENKTKDLTTSVPILAGVSSFDIFNSGPKKLVDGLNFFYLNNKRVLGCKPSRINDDKILGLDGWVTTLPAYRLVDNGIKCIAEDDSIVTNTRCHVYDIDAISSYPSDTIAANISKQTTMKEIKSISGFTKEGFMYQNINLSSGNVNSIEYCTNMFNFPTLDELETKIDGLINH